MSDKEEKEVKEVPKGSTLEADITKYKTAADIVHAVTKKLVELCVEGAAIIDLCLEGDKQLEQGIGAVYNKGPKATRAPKGIAFPTSISVNNVVSHFSPLASDPQASEKLAKGDVVKIHLGAHIDGFAAVSAETVIVGASESEPATGRQAEVVKAAWTAAEAAMRTIKAGNKNWAVTEVINKAVAPWNCKAVEGMLSCQQSQNVMDGKKRIILNPSESQRTGFESATFAENEIYGMDILVSSATDGKAREEESRTTIYSRVSDVTYQLKLKTSRAVFSEVQKKAGAFPFNIRTFEDEKKARMGLQEAVQHGLVRPYDIVYTPPGTYVAAFHFTIAILPNGPTMISHPPVWYKSSLLKTEQELEEEELKALLAKPLRDSKKKKKKAAAQEEGAEKAA